MRYKIGENRQAPLLNDVEPFVNDKKKGLVSLHENLTLILGQGNGLLV